MNGELGSFKEFEWMKKGMHPEMVICLIHCQMLDIKYDCLVHFNLCQYHFFLFILILCAAELVLHDFVLSADVLQEYFDSLPESVLMWSYCCTNENVFFFSFLTNTELFFSPDNRYQIYV